MGLCDHRSQREDHARAEFPESLRPDGQTHDVCFLEADVPHTHVRIEPSYEPFIRKRLYTGITQSPDG